MTLNANTSVTATFGPPPQPLSPGRLAAFDGYTVAVHKDGRVVSIGTGMIGGSGTTLPGTAAKQITGLSNITSVYVSALGLVEPNLAIASDGTVQGWGGGILGASVTGLFGSIVNTPIAIPAASPARSTSVCNVVGVPPILFALKSDGTVTFTPATSQTASNAVRTSTTQAVPGLSSVVSMSQHCFDNLPPKLAVVKSDGTVWTLAISTTAVSGPSPFLSTTTYSLAMDQVAGLPAIDQVACNDEVSATGFCWALAKNGTVWAWGDNSSGQLGDGTEIGRTIPIQVPGLTAIRHVVASLIASYAIDTNGAVWSWGATIVNPYVLGRGTPLKPGVPGVVTLPAPAIALAASGSHAAVILSDGALWSWGANLQGQLGLATTGNTTDVPVQAVGLNLNN